MSRARRLPHAVALLVTALAVGACGSGGIEVAKNDPTYRGTLIFKEHCSGCHTLAAAGTEGSATNVATREYKDGPNFNVRKEDAADVIYAIENGGFSSGPMPQNIVTGADAKAVAEFVAKYSGREAPKIPNPSQSSGTP